MENLLKKGRMSTYFRKYTNEALEDAIYEIYDQGISIRTASTKYGVPKSTISDRLSMISDLTIVKEIEKEKQLLGKAMPVPIRLCIVCHCRRSAKRRFHRFPKNAKGRKKWLEALQLEDKRIESTSSVCSLHFRPEDFKISNTQNRIKKCLKTDAVPSQFLGDQICEFFKREKDISSTMESNQSFVENDVAVEKDLKDFNVFLMLGSIDSERVQTKIQIFQETNIENLVKRLAETEAKVEELENLYGKLQQMRFNDFNKNRVEFLEKQLLEKEEKVQELEHHCKSLCEIVNSLNKTVNDLKGRLTLSEKEKAEIRKIKAQKIVTLVANQNRKPTNFDFSDSD